MKSSELAKARYAAKSLEELRIVARKFGLSDGWAYHVWQGRVNKRKEK